MLSKVDLSLFHSQNFGCLPKTSEEKNNKQISFDHSQHRFTALYTVRKLSIKDLMTVKEQINTINYEETFHFFFVFSEKQVIFNRIINHIKSLVPINFKLIHLKPVVPSSETLASQFPSRPGYFKVEFKLTISASIIN